MTVWHLMVVADGGYRAEVGLDAAGPPGSGQRQLRAPLLEIAPQECPATKWG